MKVRMVLHLWLLAGLAALAAGCALFGDSSIDVQITSSAHEGPIPLTVQLGARAAGADGAEFAWDLDGDARFDVRTDQLQPTFRRAGTYRVRARAETADGRSGVSDVTIEAAPPGRPTVVVGGDVDPPGVAIDAQQTGAAKLTVEGAPASGVSEVRVTSLRYDPTVVRVDGIDGAAGFRIADLQIDASAGLASFRARADTPAQGESVEVARVRLRAVAFAGSDDHLRLNVADVIDGSGQPVSSFETLDGRVRVR